MKSYETTMKYLQNLGLRGILNALDELINDASRQKVSYIQFLDTMFSCEIESRAARRLQRNMTGAHFPTEKRIEAFEFGNVKGIGKTDAVNLLDCHFIDRHENLLFFGPPGIGKTHLAIAFGIQAVEKGYKVCFERIGSLIKLLRTAEIQKTAGYRIQRIIKSDLLIIDEIGYTPISRAEANLFFTLVSEMYEKSSLIITSNKNFEGWAEMMGDDVLTTALLDRLLHHAHIYNLDGDSYRLKNKT